MFELTHKDLFSADQPTTKLIGRLDPDLMASFCQAEEWHASGETGRFSLGNLALHNHDITENQCGLITLIRKYEEMDRDRILEIFESASEKVSKFTFSTITEKPNGQAQPVIVIGESFETDDKVISMRGIFIFPNIFDQLRQLFTQ